MSNEAGSDEMAQNDVATCQQIDTQPSRACSPAVHGAIMTLDLESTRRDLIAMRVKHGADSAIGMTCSNIIEQLQNYEAAEQAEHREWLLKAIREQMARLAALNAEERGTL